MDALGGANLCTSSAGDALFIVDNGKVINNFNCARRTFLFALMASDASVFAVFSCNCALIKGVAHNCNLGISGQKLNDVLGTFLNAHSAADANLGVNSCNAVVNADRIGGANACTVAASDTAETASVGAAIYH